MIQRRFSVLCFMQAKKCITLYTAYSIPKGSYWSFKVAGYLFSSLLSTVPQSFFLFLLMQAVCLHCTSLFYTFTRGFWLSLGSRGAEVTRRRVQWDIDPQRRLARFVPRKSEFKVCHAKKELWRLSYNRASGCERNKRPKKPPQKTQLCKEDPLYTT